MKLLLMPSYETSFLDLQLVTANATNRPARSGLQHGSSWRHQHPWVPKRKFLSLCMGVQEKAANANIQLSVARSLDEMHQPDGSPIHFGLAGAYQRINAALAVELAACWEDRVVAHSGSSHSHQAAARVELLRSGQLPTAYQEGLRHCIWPGRAQVTLDGLPFFPTISLLALVDPG